MEKGIYTIFFPLIHSFPSILKELHADFGVAPLLNNSFNRCKSNIKYLDYASADIVAITSKLSPYKESQLFLHNDWKKDRAQILDIWNNPEKKKSILTKQRKTLNKYWLETTGLKKYKELFGMV